MSYQLINGDALPILRTLESKKFKLIAFSPPYWQKRVYPDMPREQQLGLEDDFKVYVIKMVEIMRQCKRVLRDDGGIFVNLGDTYNAAKNGNTNGTGKGKVKQKATINDMRIRKPLQLDAPKGGLLHIPHRIAIRCTDELGLACINDLIWYKKNAMPEGKNKRYNNDFELCFLFVKDASLSAFKTQFEDFADSERYTDPRKHRNTKNINARENKQAGINDNAHRARMLDKLQKGEIKQRVKRAVWNIPLENGKVKSAHIAAFPTALIESPFRALCEPGDWVLDPFAGSLTVGEVALAGGCNFVGIDGSKTYLEASESRLIKALNKSNSLIQLDNNVGRNNFEEIVAYP